MTEAWGDVSWWQERLEDPCFVYVIRAGGPIKVGVARDVAARLATLQTGNPYRFELLCVLPGAHDLEHELHGRLEPDRLEGEWFDGPLVEPFLTFVAEVAAKMAAAHEDGVAPDWKRAIGSWRLNKRHKGRSGPVTVRYGDPSPMSAEEREAFRARAAYESEIRRQRNEARLLREPNLC